MPKRERECEAQIPEECHIHGSRIPESAYLPSYARSMGEAERLYAALMTASGVSRVRDVSAAYETNKLNLDASSEGITMLQAEINEAAAQGLSAFAAEQRLAEAQIHRGQRRAERAIKDFQSIEPGQMRPQAVERLFAESGATVTHDGYNLRINGGEPIDYTTPSGQAAIVATRQELQRTESARYGYNQQALLDEVTRLPRTSVRYNEQAKAHIVSGPRGAYLTVQFDATTGAFKTASYAHRSGDGSMLPLMGPVALRKMLHQVDTGEITPRPLPGWITGQRESAPASAGQTPRPRQMNTARPAHPGPNATSAQRLAYREQLLGRGSARV